MGIYDGLFPIILGKEKQPNRNLQILKFVIFFLQSTILMGGELTKKNNLGSID